MKPSLRSSFYFSFPTGSCSPCINLSFSESFFFCAALKASPGAVLSAPALSLPLQPDPPVPAAVLSPGCSPFCHRDSALASLPQRWVWHCGSAYPAGLPCTGDSSWSHSSGSWSSGTGGLSWGQRIHPPWHSLENRNHLHLRRLPCSACVLPLCCELSHALLWNNKPRASWSRPISSRGLIS